MISSFQLFLPFSPHIHLPWLLWAGLFFFFQANLWFACFFSLVILPLPVGVHVATSSCLICLIIIVFTFLSPNITECTLVNLCRRAFHQEGSQGEWETRERALAVTSRGKTGAGPGQGSSLFRNTGYSCHPALCESHTVNYL